MYSSKGCAVCAIRRNALGRQTDGPHPTRIARNSRWRGRPRSFCVQSPCRLQDGDKCTSSLARSPFEPDEVLLENLTAQGGRASHHRGVEWVKKCSDQSFIIAGVTPSACPLTWISTIWRSRDRNRGQNQCRIRAHSNAGVLEMVKCSTLQTHNYFVASCTHVCMVGMSGSGVSSLHVGTTRRRPSACVWKGVQEAASCMFVIRFVGREGTCRHARP